MTKKVLNVLLDDMGFGQSELATAIGYPMATLRAWRDGELERADLATYEDIRGALHDIAIMVSRLGRHRGKDGGGPPEAALFGMTLVAGYTATGWNLYQRQDGRRCAAPAGGRHNGLCLLALGEEPRRVLDRFRPNWRTDFWTDFELFVAADGRKSIRKKSSLP